MPGEYKICFDNSFSRFSNKILFFEISTGENEEKETNEWDDVNDALEELIDVTLEYFKVGV